MEPRMRLLLVEDYQMLRESLARGLASHGFAVDATGDGLEGRWFATSNDYDVVVLDIMLPGASGLEILAAMRAARKTAPVLLLTAKDEVDDRVNGLDAGADDYLTKPFAVSELLARIRALVRRGHRVSDPAIRIGALTLDTASRIATYGGEDLALTPREYALLEYLAMRPDATVTRAELWEHLYPFSDESTSNVVEAAIARVRRKLDAHGPALIHTRRGFGYVLALKEPDA
jgi:two-component system, OmpR family, response regulator